MIKPSARVATNLPVTSKIFTETFSFCERENEIVVVVVFENGFGKIFTASVFIFSIMPVMLPSFAIYRVFSIIE